jgi:hypothetical protein
MFALFMILNGDTVIFHFAKLKPWINQHRDQIGAEAPQLLRLWDELLGNARQHLNQAGIDSDYILSSLNNKSIKYYLDKQARYISSHIDAATES